MRLENQEEGFKDGQVAQFVTTLMFSVRLIGARAEPNRQKNSSKKRYYLKMVFNYLVCSNKILRVTNKMFR